MGRRYRSHRHPAAPRRHPFRRSGRTSRRARRDPPPRSGAADARGGTRDRCARSAGTAAPAPRPRYPRCCRWAFPDVLHVACFDTSFHTTLPSATRTYALPRSWRKRWSIDRFGFHGLSHAWAAARGAAIAGLPSSAGIKTCHLGAGASLCAVVGGRSVDTTMGVHPARRHRHGHQCRGSRPRSPSLAPHRRRARYRRSHRRTRASRRPCRLGRQRSPWCRSR